MPWDPFGDPSDDKHSGFVDINTLIFPYLKQLVDDGILHDNHFHTKERWCGISADQSGDDWALPAGLNVFQAISGAAAFGSDPNDEAKLMGLDDSPIDAGNITFDMHRIMVDAASNANPFVLRIIWGTGTMAEGEGDGQYSDVMVTEARKGSPIDIRMPRLRAGIDKVWLRAKNGTNNATIDFFIGIHEYDEEF